MDDMIIFLIIYIYQKKLLKQNFLPNLNFSVRIIYTFKDLIQTIIFHYHYGISESNSRAQSLIDLFRNVVRNT